MLQNRQQALPIGKGLRALPIALSHASGLVEREPQESIIAQKFITGENLHDKGPFASLDLAVLTELRWLTMYYTHSIGVTRIGRILEKSSQELS
jgi:hypothetical protein